MHIPTDVLNIINDYYVSMMVHDVRQKLNTEFHKNNVVCHLKSFHETTLVDNKFCHKFCLAVLNYMRRHHMFI